MAAIQTMREDALAKLIMERDAYLRSERQILESVWQNIARYVIPSEATFTEEITPGVERNRYVLDSTAPRSLEMFASFLHSFLNNPASQWIKIRLLGENPKRPNTAMTQWKEEVAAIMLDALSNQDAQLYSSLHQVYLGLGSMGTSVLYEDVVRNRLAVRNYHLADCTIDEDAYGIVDTVIRQMKYSKRQAAQRWEQIKDYPNWERREAKGKCLSFAHGVFPTTDDEVMGTLTKRDLARVRNAPFVSAWVDIDSRKTMQVGLFEEMPYMVPRWYKSRGEKYGRSPAMTALPDIRMVNRMAETILRGAEKLVDPPLVIRDGGLVSPVRIFPGAITFTDGDVKIETLIPPGASRIEYGEALRKQCQDAIREAFFVPLFVTPDSPVKTATQVLHQADERNRAVSPMLIRTQDELFHGLLKRSYGLLARNGLIPPPPMEIPEGSLSIEYASPLQASQKQVEALGAMRIVEGLLPWAQIDPNVFDPFNATEVAHIVHAGSGAPASMLESITAIAAKRKARTDAANQQQTLQNMIASVEAGAKVQAANRPRG